VRVCDCEPPLQALLHDVQSDHALTMQSILLMTGGHACVLHGWESAKAGHATPPFAAWVITVRVRDWTPRPHREEQAPHDDQEETAQLVGALPVTS